jgi:hypothetical protein
MGVLHTDNGVMTMAVTATLMILHLNFSDTHFACYGVAHERNEVRFVSASGNTRPSRDETSIVAVEYIDEMKHIYNV